MCCSGVGLLSFKSFSIQLYGFRKFMGPTCSEGKGRVNGVRIVVGGEWEGAVSRM